MTFEQPYWKHQVLKYLKSLPIIPTFVNAKDQLLLELGTAAFHENADKIKTLLKNLKRRGLNEDLNQRSFVCQCGASFSRKGNLTAHQKSQHSFAMGQSISPPLSFSSEADELFWKRVSLENEGEMTHDALLQSTRAGTNLEVTNQE